MVGRLITVDLKLSRECVEKIAPATLDIECFYCGVCVLVFRRYSGINANNENEYIYDVAEDHRCDELTLALARDEQFENNYSRR